MKKESAINKSDIDMRLNRLVGQLQGIRKMIHEKREVGQVAQQIVAAREALSRLGLLVLKEELQKEYKGDAKELEKILKSVFGI